MTGMVMCPVVMPRLGRGLGGSPTDEESCGKDRERRRALQDQPAALRLLPGLWLRGCERQNAGAYGRNIYIHGTPQENLIGRPASYGCIRMRSRDIVRLFDSVDTGTKIEVVNAPLSRARRQMLASR